MNQHLAQRVLLVAGVVSLALLAFWWFVRGFGEPPPSLDEICALARSREFDQAQSLLERYLASNPRSARGHLLMAQFATDRSNPQPSRALEHLQLIRPESPAQSARVEFCKGKAQYQRPRYDLAERCWLEALRLDPTVPEAGWALMDLYGLEGRLEEAHQLGLRLHEIEPDPRDQVRFLLTLARLDLDRTAPGSQVNIFEPMAQKVPRDLHLSIALGLALVHDSRPDRGLAILRENLERHPTSPESWDALLTGLDDAGRPDELIAEFERLPKSIASDPRFAKHQGQVEQVAHNWKAAADAYRRALADQPFNAVILYRLSRVLKVAGDETGTDRINERLSTYQKAYKELRPVLDDALAIKTLGVEPRPDLYQRIAEIREQMGRFDEARAWHRLVLRDFPDQKVSLLALERLQ